MDNKGLYARIEHSARTLLNAAAGTTHVISSLVRQAIQSQQDVSPVALKPHLKNLEALYAEFDRVLDSLSEFMQIEKGDTSSNIRAIDFPALLKQVSYPFLQLAREKNIAFEIDYQDEASPIVYADQDRLSQVLNHVLENAFTYTLAGRIDVVVSSSWQPRGKTPMLEVSVIDTGVGIDSNSDKIQDTGLGLGLKIATHFVETMGGKISVSSLIDRGTRVTFTLPVTNKIASEHVVKELSSLRIWGVQSEESLADDLEAQLQFPRLVSEIVPLSEVIFKLQKTPNAQLPHIIIVVGHKLTQNMSYFARALHANPQFQPIFLAITLDVDHAELEREQAYSHGYHAVLQATKYILFAEALIDSWTRWKRKGEQDMVLKSHGASRKILVIEDHLINQKVIKMLLSEMGLEADIASSGRAGLKLLDKNSYVALIVDLGLPDMSGLDVITEIRARADEKSSLPIIVLTAGGHRETIDEIQERHIDAYLLKPVTITQLREVLSPFVRTTLAA
jgi:CheY-like chemotaxis protein/two-component sensor histidine kinase